MQESTMPTPHVKKEVKHFDPFTPSEYVNLLRIIRLHGRIYPEIVTVRGDSFTVEEDLLLKDYLSLDGIFNHPYEINKNSITITVLKDSFFTAGQESCGKISLIMEAAIRIASLGGDDMTFFPDVMEFRLYSMMLFEEYMESGLISKRKVYLEKTFHHRSTMTSSVPAWEEHSPSHSVKGYFKLDASAGTILEEAYA